ncbi:pyridoxamine 5'-phosphate oxidase family protein [Brachybacterium huguangmaarense]|uniref:Pyridoxamine 5'-phosphate oxidase family protein n=1 Tax=Brachybacterium huguangmaarense TaxID=1652028 RepID=A0ABY6FZ73_9MICO|nr:pyridoxamine 5'-phosphate oxidase family protein [Brachybacterium huguangmaarense]UYG16250.1 pyridoxamine 5'-phosphate oxidase family protein [Brachybacterium huguangmaarense]
MTSLNDVLPVDRTALLTTLGPDGPRTRPVAVQPDPLDEPGVAAVLTLAQARKAADVRERPAVTLAGATPDGFYAIEADAEVVEDPALVARAMAHFVGGDVPEGGAGASAHEGPATVLLRLRPRAAKRWVVHSPRPFDSDVEDLEV